MADELQQHLDNSLYGTPQLRPDEQRKYLGTFRERCYLQMTISQMRDKTLQELFQLHVTDYETAHCLMNNQVSDTLQAFYIQLLTQAKMPFTIVSSEEASDEAIGLLLISDEAVNDEVIDITKKYPTASQTDPQEQKNASFWGKLFH